MMPLPTFFPLLLLLLLLPCLSSIPASNALPPPKGYFINCGAKEETRVGEIKWLTDEGFVGVGNASGVATRGVSPTLATLRHFPDAAARKSCYAVPVAKGSRYLVRTTYYYGGFDGGSRPPVFDQIVGGTRWSTVDTAADYARGLASYYELVFAATGKALSVCLARVAGGGSPFISALEVAPLEDSMYNATDFSAYALATVARHRFGGDGGILSYPEDPFNRYWGALQDEEGNPVVESHGRVDPSEFWNLPPAEALRWGVTTSRGKRLELRWPPAELPGASYYVALYFQDNRTPSPFSWRVFHVALNGRTFYHALNVSAAGVMVYAAGWPLAGRTQITLTPQDGSPVGPVINAGEILELLPLAGRTVTRDEAAMEEMARSLNNVPSDWSGDPCLPKGNAWTGITCSEGRLVRVTSLNLTNYGLSGSLPDCISSLTALTSIWLGGNKISGTIPDLGDLQQLASLHLEDNQFTGPIPASLGSLEKIREIFLQNNDLHGPLPESLASRSGINIKISPGNQITQA